MKHKATQGTGLTKIPLMQLFAIQSGVLLLGSAGLFFAGATTAYSALFGGLIFIVPNMYFALRAFRYSGARAASEVARSFYRGEAGKFLLTVSLFAGVFALVTPVEVVTLFLAYIAIMILNGLLVFRYTR